MDTDAELIDRLRAIWGKYRFHIVCGLAMALAAVGGFSWENLHRQTERRAANEALFRVLLAARDERPQDAEAAFAELQSDSYPDLRYLGAFALADQRAAEENYEGAEVVLREIVDNSEDDGLRDIAALRLAEVMTGRGAFAEAEELLNQRIPNQGAARILFQDRLGDAAALRGDSEKALEAYRQAEVQARQDFPNYIPLLEFKIGALLAGVDVDKNDPAASEDQADAEPDNAEDEEGDAEEALENDPDPEEDSQ